MLIAEEEARLEAERLDMERQEALKMSLMAENERFRYEKEKAALKEMKRLEAEKEKFSIIRKFSKILIIITI